MKAKNWRAPERPYTRADYIAGAPQPRIAKYTHGKYSDDYEYELLLVAKEDMQIRDAALEAARIALTKRLSSALGSDGFYAELKAHPHHVLRENKMIFGAHADRLQEGMRRAFGKPIGRAARVEPGQEIIVVQVNEDGLGAAKEALRRAGAKLPTPCRIVIEKLPAQIVQAQS